LPYKTAAEKNAEIIRQREHPAEIIPESMHQTIHDLHFRPYLRPQSIDGHLRILLNESPAIEGSGAYVNNFTFGYDET
jgi:hypothetical protein